MGFRRGEIDNLLYWRQFTIISEIRWRFEVCYLKVSEVVNPWSWVQITRCGERKRGFERFKVNGILTLVWFFLIDPRLFFDRDFSISRCAPFWWSRRTFWWCWWGFSRSRHLLAIVHFYFQRSRSNFFEWHFSKLLGPFIILDHTFYPFRRRLFFINPFKNTHTLYLLLYNKLSNKNIYINKYNLSQKGYRVY